MSQELRKDALNRLEHGRLVITGKSRRTSEHITLRFKAKNRETRKTNMFLSEAKIVGIDAGRVQEREVTTKDGQTHIYSSSAADRVAWIWADQILKPSAPGPSRNLDADDARYWLAKHLIGWLRGQHDLHPDLEVHLEDFCGYCGRQLTHPESKERGLGPVCYGKKTEGQHQTKKKSDTQVQLAV